MARARGTCVAALAAAAAWASLGGCEIYSLAGLTGGDAGQDAGSWGAGDDAAADDSDDTPTAGQDAATHDAGPKDGASGAEEDGDVGGGSGADGSRDGSADAPAGSDAPSDAPGTARVVFVTTQLEAGVFGTIGTGDNLCKGLAMQAHLPGKYLAWLSDSASSPATRMTQSPAPYVLPDGKTVVAADWTQLVSGKLAHPIDQTEQGTTVAASKKQVCSGTAGYFVWTGTTPSGVLSAGQTCNGWKSATGFVGGVGDALATNGEWTAWCSQACTVTAALYCVEQ